MQVTRRLAGLAVAVVAAVALPLTLAQPAQAACAAGTYPPSSCPPALSLTAPAAPFTLAVARPAWKAVTFGAPISYYQLRYARAPWNGSLSAYAYPSGWQHLTVTAVSLTLPVGYTYCFSVRGVDSANRVGAWTARRCTARPLDDRSVAVSRSWTRGTNRYYYFGTYSTTRVLNASAVRTGAVVARIAVVGTRCPSCGTVGVYVGSRLLARLNFASSTTAAKTILVTPAFSARAGTITLRNLTGGRRILLDGLGISRV